MPTVPSAGCELYYETFGEGSPNLLWVMPAGWPGPDWVRLSRTMRDVGARGVAMAAYDRRGTGRSLPATGQTDPDLHVRDLGAVADALGWERFAVAALGSGALGAGAAVTYAARHPERVERLLLWNPNRAFFATEQWPHGMPEAAAEAAGDLLAASAGSGASGILDFLLPGLGPSARDEALRVVKAGMADPGYADAWATGGTQMVPEADYRAVRCPTLVFHVGMDPLCPVEAARWAAQAIPGARLLEFPEMGWADLVELGAGDPAFEAAAEFVLAGAAEQASR